MISQSFLITITLFDLLFLERDFVLLIMTSSSNQFGQHETTIVESKWFARIHLNLNLFVCLRFVFLCIFGSLRVSYCLLLSNRRPPVDIGLT